MGGGIIQRRNTAIQLFIFNKAEILSKIVAAKIY